MITNQKTKVEQEAGELLDHIKDYVETRSELTRLTVLDKTSQAAGAAMGGFIIGFLFFLFFIFLGFAVAYVIAEYTGHTYIGFISVAGIYFIAGVLFAWKKKEWIQQPMADKIIRNYFEEHESKED
jgi:energy-coupling factor transporter transmembrane protein EcfT